MAKEENVAYNLKLGTEEAVKGLKVVNQTLDGTEKSVNNVGKAIKNAFQSTDILGFAKSLNKLLNLMMKATEAEAEYVESMNLLAVSYRADTEEGERLFNQTNELLGSMQKILGLDPAKLTQQVGIYKQMTSAMGMTNETSALLAENLIKLQQDTASLYNLQSSEVATKFQSALAGQTRAVRSLGVDITQASLQQELYNLGINKSINELNRASKSVLIYLAMERQLSNANGDASRTINSMANQMKIFKEQVAIAGRQIGAVFIPILKQILPIANAILMVFNDIMEIILGLLGVDVRSMATEFGQKSVDIADSFGGVADSAGKATKKVKELLGLRGFDKLNNITTPQDTGSSGGGGISGGGGGLGKVDKGLLDALDEYNLHLDETMNKARAIADWIEQWLIYTDETGKHLTPLGYALAGIVGMFVTSKIIGMFETVFKGIKFLTGGSGLGLIGSLLKNVWAFLSTIVTGIVEIFKGTTTLGELFGALFPKTSAFLSGVVGFLGKIISGIGGVISGLLELPIGVIVLVILRVVDILASIPRKIKEIGKVIDKLKNGKNIFEAILPENYKEFVEKVFYSLPFTNLLKLINDMIGQKVNFDAFLQSIADTLENFIENAKNIILPIVDWLKEHIAKPALEIFDNTIGALFRLIKTVATEIVNTIWDKIKWLWEYIKVFIQWWYDVITNIVGFIKGVIEIIVLSIQEAYKWVKDKWLDPLAKKVKEFWDGVKKGAETCWNAIKSVFTPFVDFFVDKFKKISEKVKKFFEWGGEIFTGIKHGVETLFKSIINALIDGINWVIRKPFDALNSILSKLHDFEFLSKHPFNWVHTINIPQIPHLAEGGFVEEGQLFVAREKGAEMVGEMNGKTAVANNDQIVQGITNGVMLGVARAMAGANGSQKIVIEADADTQGLMNFISFKQKERDRQYDL